MPLAYHEIRLDAGAADLQQYVGVGTEGLVVDLPYFVQLAPSGSTAFRVRHQYRSGFGWYGTDPGWSSISSAATASPGSRKARSRWDGSPIRTGGCIGITRSSSARASRLYTFFDYPAHRDLFGQVNLYQKLGFGSMTFNLSGNKIHDRSLARNLDLNLEFELLADC